MAALLGLEAAPELAEAAESGSSLSSAASHFGDAGKIAGGLNSMLNFGKNLQETFFHPRKRRQHKSQMMNTRPGRQLGPGPRRGPMMQPMTPQNLIETRK